MIPSIWRNKKRYIEAMFEELLTEVSLENTLYRMLSWPRLHPDQNQAYS